MDVPLVGESWQFFILVVVHLPGAVWQFFIFFSVCIKAFVSNNVLCNRRTLDFAKIERFQSPLKECFVDPRDLIIFLCIEK